MGAQLSEADGNMSLFQVAERIEHVMAREKKMFANLDYYTAVIYRLCGIPAELYPPMFLIARVPGLIAHIAEQRANNRLIHPSSKYAGPEPRPLPTPRRLGRRCALTRKFEVREMKMSFDDKIKDHEERRRKAMAMGGPDKLAKRQEQGS